MIMNFQTRRLQKRIKALFALLHFPKLSIKYRFSDYVAVSSLSIHHILVIILEDKSLFIKR